MKFSCSSLGCEIKGELFILIDSTQHVTPQDFGQQKSFITALLLELDKTNFRLTTQVYSNDSICKRAVLDPQNSFRLVNDPDKISSKLDTLKYDSSGGSFNFGCVTALATSQLRVSSFDDILSGSFTSLKEFCG